MEIVGFQATTSTSLKPSLKIKTVYRDKLHVKLTFYGDFFIWHDTNYESHRLWILVVEKSWFEVVLLPLELQLGVTGLTMKSALYQTVI